MSHRLWRAGYFVAACAMAGSVCVVAQGVPWPAEFAPARAGLRVVPLPPIDALEPLVAAHLQEARQEYEGVAARRGRADVALADAYGTLGRVFHAYEFFEAAEACYRNASQLRPTDVRWLHLRGYLYQQSGRLDEAVDLYLAALRSGPDNPAATIRLGETYLGLGRTALAREQFQAVLARYPAAASAGLGEVALRDGRHQDAVQYLEAALERIPDATSLHYSLAMAYRGLGRLDEARSHLQRRGPSGIRVVDPIVDVLQTLVRGERAFEMQGRRAYEAGQFRDAAEAFRSAVTAAPSSVSPRVNLGLALSQLGDTAGAAEQFEQAFRLDPDDLVAHASLGQLLARQGRDGEAVDHLRTAFRQAPGDVTLSGELVRTLVRLGRGDEAIEVIGRARTAGIDDEAWTLSLSLLLSDLGRFREELDLLEEAHRRFPERTATTTLLSNRLGASPDLSLRNGDRALELAMAVYGTHPSPAAGEMVALSLGELGRCAEAAEWLRRALAAAEETGNAELVAHLSADLGRYDASPCRTPGR